MAAPKKPAAKKAAVKKAAIKKSKKPTMSAAELMKLRDEAATALAAFNKELTQATKLEGKVHFKDVSQVLSTYGKGFTAGQKSLVAKWLGLEVVKAEKVKKEKAPKATPLFQLDSGETWGGHGRKSNDFDTAWKKVLKANPNAVMPPFPNPKAPKKPVA